MPITVSNRSINLLLRLKHFLRRCLPVHDVKKFDVSLHRLLCACERLLPELRAACLPHCQLPLERLGAMAEELLKPSVDDNLLCIQERTAVLLGEALEPAERLGGIRLSNGRPFLFT